MATGQPVRAAPHTLAERLLKLRPTARNLALAASYFGSVGDQRRGVALVGRAVTIDSSCIDCYSIGSDLLAALGELPQAVEARRTAVALSGEHVAERERARLRELEALLIRQRTEHAN